MRAAGVNCLGEPLSIDTIPLPTPGPHEALVRVEYSGVCPADLHTAQGNWPITVDPPFTPGHEGVGEVVMIGTGVTRIGLGDKVGNSWLWSACGSCEQCEAGWESLCPYQQIGGQDADGSFAEYMLVDARYCPILPGGVNLAAATSILCGGVTVYKGIKITGTKPGDWMLISGTDGLGHLGVQYANAMGLRVLAVADRDSLVDLAREHGAEATVNTRTCPDPARAIRELTNGGCHSALVTAVTGQTVPLALRALRRGGTACLVGVPRASFDFDVFTTVRHGLTVRGSIAGTRRDMAEALEFFARGKVNPTYTVRTLDEINDVFADMAADVIDGQIVMKLG